MSWSVRLLTWPGVGGDRLSVCGPYMNCSSEAAVRVCEGLHGGPLAGLEKMPPGRLSEGKETACRDAG